MLFSLIIPTIHRTLELARLLKSIAQQQLNGFKLGDMEAIIVDQNPDDRLVSVIEPYRGLFDVVRLTAPPLGQSNAKNIGMKSFRGQYLAFPDDDCFYAKDSLEKVLRAFRETKDESVVFGRGLDLESGKFLLEYPPASRVIRGPKNPDAFLGLQIAQFYTAAMVRAVGDFDVELCSGGKWGSGEETDYALRALKAGLPIFFDPEVLVYHPLVTPGNMEIEKLKKYSIGYGALCRKQGLYFLLLGKTIKQFLGFALFSILVNFKRARISGVIMTARLGGFWQYGKKGGTMK